MGFKARVRDPQVEAWLQERGPQGQLMQAVREAILAADSRVGECIKWSCPTFTYGGNIVSINPQAKKFVSLMFHTGATIPAVLPQLTGNGKTCKYMHIEDAADLKAKQEDLAQVIRAWCDWKSS